MNELLKSYQSLWSNRSLKEVHNEELTLKDIIKAELLDEKTHPRLRKSPEAKFVQASKRIVYSNLSHEEKLQLLLLHHEVIEEIRS